MDMGHAEQTLRGVEQLRRETRARLRSLWFPLLVFGMLTLVSAPVLWLAGGPAVAVYWAVAGPLGGVLTGGYYQRRERHLGVEGPAAPYIATGLGIMVGCFLTAGFGRAVGSDVTTAVGPSLVVSAGYLVFAWLDRSLALAVVAAGLGAVALALAPGSTGDDVDRTAAMLALAYGVAFVATGIAYRMVEHRQP